jgi:two-component system, OmpR family, alkaline phosphatase synthesis response regulator PhoP
MANEKILVVEDEKDLVRLLQYNLEQQHYRVQTALDGQAAIAAFRKDKPDLILLDLMIPKMDGLEVCRTIRQESNVPIIMVTARKEELDKVLGLELGADDYITKPFSIREMLARIKTILRRSKPDGKLEEVLQFGELRMDPERFTVVIKEKSAALSSKEFQFLKVLIEANGKALSREQLLEKVWGYDRSFDIDTRTIDQHIARLRDKLGAEAKRILTVKNVGYRFDTGP